MSNLYVVCINKGREDYDDARRTMAHPLHQIMWARRDVHSKAVMHWSFEHLDTVYGTRTGKLKSHP